MLLIYDPFAVKKIPVVIDDCLRFGEFHAIGFYCLWLGDVPCGLRESCYLSILENIEPLSDKLYFKPLWLMINPKKNPDHAALVLFFIFAS